MSQPKVTQNEIDGALGVMPPTSGGALAVAGVSTLGTVDMPAVFARVEPLVAAFGAGPLVEAAARHIEKTGNAVAVVRTAQSTLGAMGTIDDADVVGTAKTFITKTAATEPVDDYEVAVEIVNGGTTGVTGITYRTSLDGGRNWSPVTALATGLVIAIAGAGVSFDIVTAKTLIAGDTWRVRTTAPAPSASELGAAIDALKNSTVVWDLLEIATPVDATNFDTIETKFAALFTNGQFRAWIGNVRMPNEDETESAYRTSLSGSFSSKASKVGELCAGACKVVSSVSGRTYRRPISFVIASAEAAVLEHVNIADLALGPLVGVAIRDANGNPDEHDETVDGGLDDLRFTTLRTWVGRSGVYVNRPRLFAATGSDFDIMPRRRVMNLARRVTLSYLEERLSKPIVVNKATGFIREEDAREIESGGNARLAAVLGPAPKASAWRMVLSRTDDLLSTKKLTVSTRVTPLAYVDSIEESIGFENPALQVQTA